MSSHNANREAKVHKGNTRSGIGHSLRVAGVIAIVAVAAGCAKQNGVVVTFGPILNAPSVCTANTPSGPLPTGICNETTKPIREIVQVACIYSISNVGKDATDFLFDITNLNFKDTPQPIFGDPLPGNPKKLPNTIMVKAGTVAKDLGVIALSAKVLGESEDEMGAQIPKFVYTNDQQSPNDPKNPYVGVAFSQYPANAHPKWDPNKAIGEVTLPICQGPK